MVKSIQPLDLGLKYPGWFPHQWESIQKIAQSKKPAILLEGPCGTGKSLVAIASAVLLKIPKTIIVVVTKQLEDQYCETPEFQGLELVNMRGRGNFTCAREPAFTVEEAPCNLEGFGCSNEEKWVYCPYYLKKRIAQKAGIVVMNASYFLHEANYVGSFSNADFLIFDEGDLLENELMRFASIELSFRSFLLSDIRIPNLSSTYEARAWAKANLSLVKRRAMETEGKARENLNHLKNAVRLKKQLKRLEELSDIEPNNWVIESKLTGFSIQPLWASDFGWRYAFRHGKRVLVMSATLPPPQVYARQVGLDSNPLYIETPSFFPKENRPINYWPIARLKGRQLDDYTLNLVANAVDLILQAHSNQKGVVHTVSYKLRDEILRRTRFGTRFISHNLGDEYVNRSQALDYFLDSSEHLVLISPSMGRGVDLFDDRARFGIQIKLPFPDLGNKQIKARMERDPEWYTSATADALVQASGRLIRHLKDWGTFYLLDGNFSWFAIRNKRFFSNWWREAVHQISDISEAIRPPQDR